tara:strand:- start:1080 stop:1214 length:135 start_codon:yes stop_codon:yes gene_type:complete
MVVKKDEVVKCPKCRSKNIRKLFAAPILHFNPTTDASLRKENII